MSDGDIMALGLGLLIIAVVMWNVRGRGRSSDSSVENASNMGSDEVDFDCD